MASTAQVSLKQLESAPVGDPAASQSPGESRFFEGRVWPRLAGERQPLARWALVRGVIVALAFLSVTIPLAAMPNQAIQYWYLYFSPVIIAALSFGLVGALGASLLTTFSLTVLFDRASELARTAAVLANRPGQSLEEFHRFAAGIMATPDLAISSPTFAQWSFQNLVQDAVLGMALTTGISCLVGWLVDENRRQLARYQELVGTDPLTGVGNYHHLMERLGHHVAAAARNGRPFAYVMIDLDGLKAFNDSQGHIAGDDVLRRVAALLRTGARRADTVARYGGDEFALVLPDTDEAGALAATERLRDVVAHYFRAPAHGGRPRITLSMGIAVSPTHGISPSQLVKAADDALYQAKLSGKDRVIVASLPSAPNSKGLGVRPESRTQSREAGQTTAA